MKETESKPPRRSGDYVDCNQDVYDVLIEVLRFDEFTAFRNLKFKLIFREKSKISKGRRVLATISL